MLTVFKNIIKMWLQTILLILNKIASYIYALKILQKKKYPLQIAIKKQR